MRALVLALAVAIVASGIPPAAGAAPAPAAAGSPMRSMTFDVDFSARIEQRIQTSGLLQTDPKGKISAPGGASVRRRQSHTEAKTTITVDVVAVTGDGLVVDVTESTQGHASPKTRIGITTQGKLVYDAVKNAISEEEVLLLQLLNRALVDGRDGDGASWTDDLSVTGLKDVSTYRILSATDVTPGPVLHVELERTVSAFSGAHPFDLIENGRFDYNEQRAIPIAVSLHTRRTNPDLNGQQIQTDALYTYKLTSDSGVKR
jgi:hypothetical protein